MTLRSMYCHKIKKKNWILLFRFPGFLLRNGSCRKKDNNLAASSTRDHHLLHRSSTQDIKISENFGKNNITCFSQ